MAFLFTWLRLSSQKLLTWSRRSNYQSKDIAWVQKVTAERVSDKVRRGRALWGRGGGGCSEPAGARACGHG
jgi:hypothetical protein